MNLFTYHPSLRFMVPMIGGIVFGNDCYEIEWVSVCLPIFIVIWIALLWANRCYRMTLFGIGVAIFFFFFGVALTCRQLERVVFPFPDTSACYQVLMVEAPVEKPKSFQCKVTLEGEWKPDGKWLPMKDKPLIVCYLAKDSLQQVPQRGDRLWIHARIKLPPVNRLPGAFDYARYLIQHGVSGTAYVSARHWKRVGYEKKRTLRQIALDYRAQVVELYHRLGFEGDEFSVLSALTVGDKEALDDDIQATYSISGASHVLALSGLHVGFLYGWMFFLFAPLWKRWRFLKIPLSVCMIAGLWLFAFFTGLSVSVVRSVMMCSLCVCFSFRLEPAHTFDVLLATAFLMLVYQPLWLFDVGFQLSFAAVASILLFYPSLYACILVKSVAGRWLWSLIAVSVSAQLGTAPLILFYFSHFSTFFLLTNLWVIPLVSLIMYTAAILLLLTPFPFLQSVLSAVLNNLLQWQNCGLRWIEQLPFASLDNIHLEVWEVAWVYLCLYGAYQCLVKPLARRVFALLGVLLLGVVVHLLVTLYTSPQRGLVFYEAQGKVSVQCMANGARSWMVDADSIPDSLFWNRVLKSHWNRLNLHRPSWVVGDVHTSELTARYPLLCYQGKWVCWLSDRRWRYKTTTHPLRIDYLCITRRYRGSIKDVSAIFQLHTVLVDAALPLFYRKRIQDECRELGLEWVELEEQSSLTYHW